MKKALLIVGLEVHNAKMASNRKRTNFESIQPRKSTMLPNVICVLTSCNIRLKTNITVHHQCHNKFVTKSTKCPTHMTKSIEYKCAMTVLGRFWSFSTKIVHPIYRISQLNVLYRIVSKKLAQYTALKASGFVVKPVATKVNRQHMFFSTLS